MITAAAALLVLATLNAAPPTLAHEVLADGTTLVVVTMPGAKQVSVRYVIRSGASDEPASRAGLAHLVEHLVMQGTYREPEGSIFEAAWTAGAEVNAFTSDEWTAYALDVAKAGVPTTLPLLLHAATAPALPFAAFERERGVVDAEHFERGDVRSFLWAVDHLVFPGANAGTTIIGTAKTRAAITPDDVQTFVAEHYVTTNAVAIVVGDVSLDEARAWVEPHLWSAPKLAAPVIADPPQPNIPSEAKALSYSTVTLQARRVTGVSRAACDTAAAVLALRLRQRIVGEEGISARTDAICYATRGQQLLVLAALSSSPDSSGLPDTLRAIGAQAGRRPIGANERRVVTSRARAAHLRGLRSPADISNALMDELGRDGPIEVAATRIVSPARLDWAGAEKALAEAAKDKNLAQIHLSRFEE